MKGIVQIEKGPIGDNVQILGSIVNDESEIPDQVFSLNNAIDGKWSVGGSTSPGNMYRSELVCRVSLACHFVMQLYQQDKAKIGDKFDVVEGPIAGLVTKRRRKPRS